MFLKKVLAIVSVLTAFGVSLHAQYMDGGYEQLYDSETVTALKSHVVNLSAAHLKGRLAGSEGEKQAAEYVTEALKAYGIDILTPVTGEEFGLKAEGADTLVSRNVIGYVEGYDRELKDEFIVVGARLDNLGTMTMTVDGRQMEKIYYGANGNASGLAMMLELARMVQTNSVLFRRSVLFVAFGASAQTYAGAWYFLNRSFSATDDIAAMVNLDMLGTGYKGFYAYTSANVDLNSLITKVSTNLHPVVPDLVNAEPYPSDHRAFYSAEIPSVMFTTGRYPERNTEKDTQAIIDYEGMERELEYIYSFTLNLANMNDAPSFRQEAVQSVGKAGADAVPYNECDMPPMFLNSTDPGKFLKEWVYHYLKYPESAVRDGVQGRVTVYFIVEKDGKVTNAKVLKGVSEELDAEALKVVAASPKWTPGRVNGNKVRTSMSVPVEFRLEKKGAKGSFGIKK